MARVVWKGAIVFGLVHIPVDLYPGSKDNDLDFDWIDKRDNAPVGYQRINKKTGKPVEMSDIVKGYEWEKGNYVILKDEDFKAANPKATQTVEILAFVDRESIPPLFFEKPYRLVPGKRGEKGYALLRETLKRTNKVGVAQVVIRNRQHLAVLMPMGDMLELITMRYADEVLGAEEFDLPSMKEAKVSDKEVQLAERLVDDMTEEWNPRQYRDSYRDDLMKRIKALATQGPHASREDAGRRGGEGRRADHRPDGGAEAQPRDQGRRQRQGGRERREACARDEAGRGREAPVDAKRQGCGQKTGLTRERDAARATATDGRRPMDTDILRSTSVGSERSRARRSGGPSTQRGSRARRAASRERAGHGRRGGDLQRIAPDPERGGTDQARRRPLQRGGRGLAASRDRAAPAVADSLSRRRLRILPFPPSSRERARRSRTASRTCGSRACAS